MGLLFVGGVMNLLWIAAIAIFVLLEKTIPFGDVAGRFAGAANDSGWRVEPGPVSRAACTVWACM